MKNPFIRPPTELATLEPAALVACGAATTAELLLTQNIIDAFNAGMTQPDLVGHLGRFFVARTTLRDRIGAEILRRTL